MESNQLLNIFNELANSPEKIDKNNLYSFFRKYYTVNIEDLSLITFIFNSMIDFALNSKYGFNIDEIFLLIYSNITFSYIPFQLNLEEILEKISNPTTKHIISDFISQKSNK